MPQDGTLVGLRGRVYADMGAYIRTNAGVVPAKAGQFLLGPYRFPHVRVEVTAVMTNKTPTGTYRAPGRVEANFFRERLLDMVARDLGLDPLAVPAQEPDHRRRTALFDRRARPLRARSCL